MREWLKYALVGIAIWATLAIVGLIFPFLRDWTHTPVGDFLFDAVGWLGCAFFSFGLMLLAFSSSTMSNTKKAGAIIALWGLLTLLDFCLSYLL